MSDLLNHSHGLRAFVQAVEAGTFSSAARLAGTTPSAISKSIGRLELELGVSLFRRSTRTLSLTPEGQIFFDHIAPLLKALQNSGDAVRPDGFAHGHLRVSIPSDLGRLLLPVINEKFLCIHPDVDLDLNLIDDHVDVIGDGYDLVFRVGELQDSGLKTRTLAKLNMVIVASPGFIAIHGQQDSIDQMRKLPFVRYLKKGRTLPIVLASGEVVSPSGRVGVDSGFGLRTAARAGVGAAYVMKCTVDADLDDGALIRLFQKAPLPNLALQAVHAFQNAVPIKVKLFTDFIQTEILKISNV